MNIEKILMKEQHRQLRSLKEKLSETLDNEPLDSGDEGENEIWKQANYLFGLLEDFFGDSVR